MLSTLLPLKAVRRRCVLFQGQKVERSDELFVLEMILWALSEHAKLNRDKLVTGLAFNDLFNSYFQGLSDEETTA